MKSKASILWVQSLVCNSKNTNELMRFINLKPLLAAVIMARSPPEGKLSLKVVTKRYGHRQSKQKILRIMLN